MPNVYGDTPEEIAANKAAEFTRRQQAFQAEYDRIKEEQAKWFRMPRSKRGEFPQLPPAPEPVP